MLVFVALSLTVTQHVFVYLQVRFSVNFSLLKLNFILSAVTVLMFLSMLLSKTQNYKQLDAFALLCNDGKLLNVK